MPTFPAATSGPIVLKNAANSRGASAIIHRALWSLGMALLLALGGCSTMRLAYNQGPNLSYWWFNDYLDLNTAQSAPFKDDLENFFQHHRADELPLYAERLKHWQSLATQDLTPAMVCAEFDAVRTAYLRGVESALPPLTRVALKLQTPQFEALASKQSKNTEKFEKEWLRGPKGERLERRFNKATERYEDFYGPLSKAQRQTLQALIQRSDFDPARMHAERQRRHTDLVASLKQAQDQPTRAQTILRGWHQRVMRSPDPAYAAYSEANTEENCAQFAALHNSTSPEQRAHAVAKLKGYERDLMALTASR